MVLIIVVYVVGVLVLGKLYVVGDLKYWFFFDLVFVILVGFCDDMLLFDFEYMEDSVV